MDMDMGHQQQQQQQQQMMPEMMMQMSFYWGKYVTLLFSGWVTKKPVEYALTLLGVFCFAVIYHMIRNFERRAGMRSSSVSRVLELVLFAAHITVSYLLMLIAMSFNGGVFLALIAGHCTGFVLFTKERRDGTLVTGAKENPSASPQP